MIENQGKSIKQWSPDERPREKLLAHGRKVLSNAELIGLLIGSGTIRKSAVDVARSLLGVVNGNLNALARLSVKDLCKVEGIGRAKAVNIIASLELGCRREISGVEQQSRVTSSKGVYQLMKSQLQDLQYEQFWVLTLSRNNHIIDKYCISDGGVSGTVADPKRIFKVALEDLASSIILLHNHPSGNKEPSVADKKLTERIVRAGTLMDINVLDHIIVAGGAYFSFADQGLI